jgi:dihydrofolate synthase / folylpolyglutamate synthase
MNQIKERMNMIITPIKTPKILPCAYPLVDIITNNIAELREDSILVITSKVVSLCENRVRSMASYDKESLVEQESDRFTKSIGPYGFHFTVTNNTLIPSAGIDESNSNGNYVLWPENPQESANNTRKLLKSYYKLKNVGIIITDSTCSPLRRGTIGIAIAHSGFAALNNYIGKPDLFGRTFTVSMSNVAGGLASGAVTAMGEGSEQTPLCLIEGIDFVQFQDRSPLASELAELRIEPNEDIFAPFLAGVEWNQGFGGKNDR